MQKRRSQFKLVPKPDSFQSGCYLHIPRHLISIVTLFSSSKDSKSDVKSMNELNTQLSGTSTSTTLSAIDTNAAAKPKHTVEPSLLYIPARKC